MTVRYIWTLPQQLLLFRLSVFEDVLIGKGSSGFQTGLKRHREIQSKLYGIKDQYPNIVVSHLCKFDRGHGRNSQDVDGTITTYLLNKKSGPVTARGWMRANREATHPGYHVHMRIRMSLTGIAARIVLILITAIAVALILLGWLIIALPLVVLVPVSAYIWRRSFQDQLRAAQAIYDALGSIDDSILPPPFPPFALAAERVEDDEQN
ncbi:MAG: hypothetical protein AAF787_21745 [Chloroflexota bacterium]